MFPVWCCNNRRNAGLREATHKIAAQFFEELASPERKKQFEKNMNLLPGSIAADPDRRFVDFCLEAGPKSWSDYNFDAAALWEGIYTNMQVIDYAWGVIFRDIDITHDLEKLDRPVFLALGKYDFLTGPHWLWDQAKNRFRDITIKIFEKSAHCPQFEEAELFDKELLEWIEGIQNKANNKNYP